MLKYIHTQEKDNEIWGNTRNSINASEIMHILLQNPDRLEGKAQSEKWVIGGQELRDEQIGYYCASEHKINTKRAWLKERLAQNIKRYCKGAKVIVTTAQIETEQNWQAGGVAARATRR